MTAHLVVRARTPLTPAAALDRLLDLDGHSEVIPCTRVLWTRPLAQGSSFTARTRVGPVVIDDVMEVRELRPAYARIVKVGRWVRGTSEITITRGPGERESRVEWRQSMTIRGLPTMIDPIVHLAARAMYATVVRTLLRTGAKGRRPRDRRRR